jgi:hypothetical protein
VTLCESDTIVTITPRAISNPPLIDALLAILVLSVDGGTLLIIINKDFNATIPACYPPADNPHDSAQVVVKDR